jgi:predicted SprT family Zn-dependent metalloprotease
MFVVLRTATRSLVIRMKAYACSTQAVVIAIRRHMFVIRIKAYVCSTQEGPPGLTQMKQGLV